MVAASLLCFAWSGQAVSAPAGGGDAATATDTPPADEDVSLHGQFTNVTQFHPSFRSPYRGPNSLDPGNRGDETIDLTLYAGVRLWQGGAFYADGEVDQGLGLSNTTGVAGFPSGEAYKIGAAVPYARLPRAFLRQVFDLGGETKAIDSDQNQLAGSQTADTVILTIGKFAVTDIFDNNAYAHDPRGDFLNWSIIDAGTFDYAADPWGYTYGATAEWTQSWWSLRGGLFNLSRVPNGKALGLDFSQYEAVIEGEERHTLFDQAGKLKLLAFVNYGRMGDYNDAVRAAAAIGGVPDVAQVRRDQARPGISLNLEQQISDALGAFVRAGLNDGSKEAYEFTEINQTISFGLSLKGAKWDRPDDTVGLAVAVNGISSEAQRYLAAGGLGILIGDGRLPHYGPEQIVETYYKLALSEHLALSADYQFIDNPAYNRDRGPVSVFGGRIHIEY